MRHQKGAKDEGQMWSRGGDTYGPGGVVRVPRLVVCAHLLSQTYHRLWRRGKVACARTHHAEACWRGGAACRGGCVTGRRDVACSGRGRARWCDGRRRWRHALRRWSVGAEASQRLAPTRTLLVGLTTVRRSRCTTTSRRRTSSCSRAHAMLGGSTLRLAGLTCTRPGLGGLSVGALCFDDCEPFEKVVGRRGQRSERCDRRLDSSRERQQRLMLRRERQLA
jgi:hypothetical protein